MKWINWCHRREAFCNIFSKEVVLGEAKQSNSTTTFDPCLDCNHIEQRNSFLNGICSFSEDSKKSEICCVAQLFEHYQEAGQIYNDLIEMALAETLRHRGRVCTVDAEQMPAPAKMAAGLRY